MPAFHATQYATLLRLRSMRSEWIGNQFNLTPLISSPKPGQMTLYQTDEHIPGDAENWSGEELLDWYHDVA